MPVWRGCPLRYAKRMKLKFLIISLVCVCIAFFTACGSDDDYTVSTVAPTTCVVTNVQMGSIPCVRTTKDSEGKDSVYVVTVTGAYYPMSIDQNKGHIFNVDSLPYGCDVAKITFTTLSCSGTLAINSLGEQETDTFFVAKDSTDFRKPRKVTVYSPNGLAKRTYNMEVRVHQEEGDKFVWTQYPNAQDAFGNATLNAAFSNNGTLFAYGEEDGAPVVFTAQTTAPTQWEKHASNQVVRSVVYYKSEYYALSDGALIQSTDGIVWNALSTTLTAPLMALANGTTALYGVTSDGFVTSTDGVNWEAQDADEPENLPTGICAATCLPSMTDNTFEDIILVGSKEDKSVVWKLNVDTEGDYSYPWIYYPDTNLNPQPCPLLTQRSVYAYDGGTLMAGVHQDGKYTLCLSRDNGRTWDVTAIPQPENATMASVTTVDAFNFIWIITPNGNIMKGRFNRLGWDKLESVFQ